MYRAGGAATEAAFDARTQILDLAAREFFDDVDAETLTIDNGIIRSASYDGANRQVSFSEVMNVLRSDAHGQVSSITGVSRKAMPPTTMHSRQFAVHFVEVEVDTDTGQIKVLDYLALQDSGTVVNPQVLKNQVIGGAICGVGFALYEELQFDPQTGAAMNANLLDYKLLRTADFPADAQVVFHESYDPVGPFGARGAGESPMAAAVPAVAQAVYNAIGVWVDIPMTPEKVIRALGGI
jgi:xanthine dehydrogenase molybdenum-binding subunit